MDRKSLLIMAAIAGFLALIFMIKGLLFPKEPVMSPDTEQMLEQKIYE